MSTSFVGDQHQHSPFGGDNRLFQEKDGNRHWSDASGFWGGEADDGKGWNEVHITGATLVEASVGQRSAGLQPSSLRQRQVGNRRPKEVRSPDARGQFANEGAAASRAKRRFPMGISRPGLRPMINGMHPSWCDVEFVHWPDDSSCHTGPTSWKSRRRSRE